VSKGYFVWHDLFAPDPARAAEFYQALFGWRLDTQDMGTGPYTMFGVGETLLGGFGPAAEGPPRWISHISVDDLDAAVAKIRDLGGSTQESFPVPGVGSIAFATDPEGAEFSAFQDENPDYQPELPNGIQPGGAIAWHEVASGDQQKADDFYSAIFGWGVVAWPFEDGEYHGLTIGDVPVAGVFQKPDAAIPSAWTIYFEAPGSIDEAAESIKQLGGTIIREPFTVEGTGDILVATDPDGAVFGILKSAPMGDS
jgi:hypothetical protein